MKKLFDKVKTFIWNIKNIVDWIPILWKNWDWDYGYLLDIMVFKLERMSKFFKKDAIVSDCHSISFEIQQCIYMIHKFRNYEDEAFLPYHQMYPFPKFDDCFQVDEQGRGIFKINKTEEQENLFRECMLKSIELRNKYKRELVEFLVEHFDNWSD
jgi:hypothetical protein